MAHRRREPAYEPPFFRQFRVEVFGRPRGPWRDTPDAAMQDAISEGLASWDEERREHFLAVPVEIAVQKVPTAR